MSTATIILSCVLCVILGWTIGYSAVDTKHEERVRKLMKLMHKKYTNSADISHGMYGLGYRAALEDIGSAIKRTWWDID